MTTFSPVISRPSNKEQLKPFGPTKPAFTMTRTGRGIWQPGYATVSPQLYKAVSALVVRSGIILLVAHM